MVNTELQTIAAQRIVGIKSSDGFDDENSLTDNDEKTSASHKNVKDMKKKISNQSPYMTDMIEYKK